MMGSVVIRSNLKVSFLGVPPQGVCTHEGTRAAGLRAIGEVISPGCFVEGEDLVCEGSRGGKEVTAAYKSPRRHELDN